MKKNKLSPKELREQQAAAKKQFIAVQKEKEAAKLKAIADEAEAKRRREEDEKRAKIVTEHLKTHPNADKDIKSTAKAAGLKSTFILNGEELLMTSFGRGNDAVLEKKIQKDGIHDLSENAAFTVSTGEKKDDKDYIIKGRTEKPATTDNPLKSNKEAGQDLIDCRRQLERIYFGENFEDNIHIQLIYSIMDLEKILAVHINNIIYEVNNLRREEDRSYEDLVGYLSVARYGTFEDFDAWKDIDDPKEDKAQLSKRFDALMKKPQRAYFGDLLYAEMPKKGDQTAAKNDEKKKAYYALCLVGTVRQAMAHQTGLTAVIYQIEKQTNPCWLEAKALLDQLYSSRINNLNEKFHEKAGKDLAILFRANGVRTLAEKKKYVQAYYDFIVRKGYKNLGFSIKQVRETILLTQSDAAELKGQEYDSVRAKLNHLFDFTCQMYYNEHPEVVNELVNRLRATRKETEKVIIYHEEANRLWNEIKVTILEHIKPLMNRAEIGAISKDEDVTSDMIADIQLKPEVHYFTKLVYLLTLFQDGKEINDLLTTLINRFETIGSFLEVLRSSGLKTEFKSKYVMFADSNVIANELRAVNSFARMSNDLNARRIMFIEAAKILGYSEDFESLQGFIDEKLNPGEHGKHGFRYFIANNVIDSSRFKYLIRYSNAENTKKLAQNRPVISFVLKDIPDAQIVRYYNACTGLNEGYMDTMRGTLTDMILAVSFDTFKNVKDDKDATTEEQLDKQKKQAVIRLYLTVLYLLTKNLVYINSRYFLAFHCVERDNEVYGTKLDLKNQGYDAFAKVFLSEERHRKNRRAIQYITTNFNNSDPWAVREFRNCVEHMSAIRDAAEYINDIREVTSYFDLYHYIVQRFLMTRYDYQVSNGKIPNLNPKVLHYLDLVAKYKTCCKDFIKALNVPFAYNLPRYKNLSIDGLFDKNRPGNVKESLNPDEEDE